MILLYSCKQTLLRLDAYLDRELTPREMLLVNRHLKICRECAKKFAFEAELLREMRARLQRLSVPPDLLEKVSELLAHAQAETEEPSSS